MEDTLVHEMLHVIMPDITPSNRERVESAIHRMTEALVAAWSGE